MYPVILLIHSHLRWLIVLVAVLTAVRALTARDAPWTRWENGLAGALVGLTDLQFLLGIVMWLGLSPVATLLFSSRDPARFSEPSILFFGAIHPVVMSIAFMVLHGARTAMKKREGAEKRRVFGRGVMAFLVMIALLIPWPFLPWGRPWMRRRDRTPTPAALTVADHADGAALYESRCVHCHGADGRGQGTLSGSLSVAPRDLTDVAFQTSHDDAALGDVIAHGGVARGLSPLMPAQPDLPPAELDALVRYVRLFRETP